MRFIGSDGNLTAVKCIKENKILDLPCDILMPFFRGLINVTRGLCFKWGIDLSDERIVVSTETFETSIPGIFAVGDINTYPGKRK